MSEEATPFPPRFRWLKRGVVLGIGVLLALGALRWWWGWHVQRQIDALIADAHAHGEPILPEDFPSSAPVPDSENAAVTWMNAAGAVTWKKETKAWEAGYMEPALAGDFAMMRRVESDNGAALSLARAARGEHQVNWGPRAAPGAASPLLAKLILLRRLSRVLTYSARAEFSVGHDSQAVELLRDIMAEARAINGCQDDLISSIVGIGTSTIAIEFGIQMGPRFGNGLEPAEIPKLETAMRGLMNDLLDEHDFVNSVVGGYRASAMDCMAGCLAPNSTTFASRSLPKPIQWVLLPMFQRVQTIAASDEEICSRAVALPNFPVANQEMAAIPSVRPAEYATLDNFSHLLDLQPRRVGGHQSMQLQFVVSTNRRATATILALRMYELDHDGQLPEKLGSLVPRYLSKLPSDPMRADGGSFGYLPHAQPPILYSVGLDGKDDGGAGVTLPGGRFDVYRWSRLDVVYSLRSDLPRIPTTESSVQTQDHN